MIVSAAPVLARRTQAQRREESENRLLDAAAAIIASEGYLAATLERVGAEAGFSRGLAGRKYGSKDGLIEAVIWRVSAHVNGQVDSAIAGQADPLDQLLALFDRFVDLALTDTSVRAYFVLFSAMIANRLETRLVFDQVQDRFGKRIEELVMAAQHAGRMPPYPSSAHASFMVGCLLAGIAIESATAAGSGEGVDPLTLRQDLSAMLRRALAV